MMDAIDEQFFKKEKMTEEEFRYYYSIIENCKDICDSKHKVNGNGKCEILQLSLKRIEPSIISLNGIVYIGKENRVINDLKDAIKKLYSNGILDCSKPYRRTTTHVSKYSSKPTTDEIEYDGVINISDDASIDQEANKSTSEIPIEEIRKEVCKKIIKFFSEFTFVPATRFINTLSKFTTQKDAKTYINNYMSLTDHPDKNEIADKIKSSEFNEILTQLFTCRGDKEINKRLEIYYGPAGTGKTTEAIKLYPDANVTVCNELMDSDSIMKVFDFNDENGHPVFKPSQLQLDMIAGRPHILDEMNLLPLNTLRFLQGVLDSKEKIKQQNTVRKITLIRYILLRIIKVLFLFQATSIMKITLCAWQKVKKDLSQTDLSVASPNPPAAREEVSLFLFQAFPNGQLCASASAHPLAVP